MAIYIVQTGNSAGVNVRASRDTTSRKLGEIANGLQVNIVRCDSTWSTLMYDGTPAFIQHRFLNAYPSVNGAGLYENEAAKCNADDVNIRTSPGGTLTGYTLSKGNSVTVSESRTIDNYVWYKIGSNRWVRGDYLTPATGSSAGGVQGGSGNGSSTNTPWPVSTNGTDGYPNSRVVSKAWIFSQPDISSDHVSSFSVGTVLYVDGHDDDFYYYGYEKYLQRSCVDLTYSNKAPNVYFGDNQNLTSGHYGYKVYALQHFLNRYLATRYGEDQRITVDGSFGSTTAAKVRDFQSYMNTQYGANMSVDGIAGPITQKWLVGYAQNVAD